MLSRSRNVEYLNRDIEILKSYYNKCSTTSKVQIREKWIFIEIKKLVVSSKCRYLQKAYNILEEDIFKAQNSLNYLKGKSKLLSSKKRVEINIFNALLYELLLNYTEASKEYKKSTLDGNYMQVYRGFIKRTKDINATVEIKCDSKEDSIDSIECNDIYILQKRAKSLENIAKYYVRSSHSISLAKKYFKQALLIHKKIFTLDLNYTRNYILALIKACETYKLSKEYLDEAQYITFHSNRCEDAEFYLLNKIKNLRTKL